MRLGSGKRSMNRCAPSPPNTPPSVDRKISWCFGPVLCGGAPTGRPYARASSTRAAVPEALSFAPAPSPESSRWAVTTIAPAFVGPVENAMFRRRLRPFPGIVASNVSTCGAYE